MLNEDEKVVHHPIRKHQKESYREVYLIISMKPNFYQKADWKQGDAIIKEWYNLGLYFYFPKKSRIMLVGIHRCFDCFNKF